MNILWALVLAFILLTPTISCSAEAAKPNILFILTDDQGYSSLGCYGGKIVPTPNLDRLASGGARFTQAYVTPICTPTRSTLMSGQYTARSGMFHVIINPWYGSPYARMEELPFVDHYPPNSFSMASGLRSGGYKTGVMGKWHLTWGDDGNYIGVNPEAAHKYGFDHAGPVIDPRKEFAPGGDRGVNTITEQAMEFIADNKDEPWFCFVSHHMIHSTVVAPEALAQEYRDRGYGEVGPNRAIYLAALETIDRSVGKLMGHLETLGEARDTIVIFLSDNGGVDQRYEHRSLKSPHPRSPTFGFDLEEYSNDPLRDGKGSNYEGGIRVPMIVNWPGNIKAGTVIDTPVHAIDFAPTFLEIGGGEPPDDHILDGQSMVQLWQTGEDALFVDRPLFQYYPSYDFNWGLTPSASIRLGDFKLIEWFGDRVSKGNQYVAGHHIELYNLANDVHEDNDLAESNPGRAGELLGRLHAWMDSVGAKASGENAHYDPDRAFLTTGTKPDWVK